MILDYKKVKNWLDHFNLPLIKKGMHASGHANGLEISEMIREIEPEKIYPIHTTKKEAFDKLNDDGIKVVHPIPTNNHLNQNPSYHQKKHDTLNPKPYPNLPQIHHQLIFNETPTKQGNPENIIDAGA
ncbi:hypothetical protein MTTB_03560 [Methanothermobacter tenebrarum]|jgi:mRNA degradation ribonuclease J1/J2|uniref:Zn-dependent metallo-hydrolase RNA specificity domain-containing protein n=1 Tax=Methanothermobacter tenebrarum TaxID=680118 RepID=A0ABN6PDI1_9EURY|nr:MBL fold metallo-hydrolase RNA specificity domain-containing protein [Methanothermobacter tenebrarum]MDD3454167.1 MBL fold metallo-hydrolase RNA specificity domain-containing protein [Methanobacteriales archaeon]MDX9693428.1 MBL fold metallo-hydrolase RNA specificity domain-containing protein [Methanothermobacter sp.]BDH78977.1 hypothetical protein MTTB_03560 [Methanothermobacter tenebrarum]